MFSNINKDNKIKGIPNGLIVGQFERTTELDERILNRAFPSSALKPNYDPRPISTKYSLFPALSGRKEVKTELEPYEDYNVHKIFNPGNTKAPPEGFLDYVDNESYLRNQSIALQKGADQGYYVPQSKSELYNDYVFTNDNRVQPHPNLFEKSSFKNPRTQHVGLKNIGNDLFHNNTRTQLRNGN
jgi:hypothetical protein|tara:strand:+ start:893 stop:1447 length:555 start_codon:yes stop_codon:yes gene_type:complete